MALKQKARSGAPPNQARAMNAEFLVESELKFSIGTAQLVRIRSRKAFERVYSDPRAHRIDMCLGNRAPSALGAYRQHWGAHRSERLGALFMAPRGEALTIRYPSGDTASIVCRLNARAMSEWLGSDLEWTERRLEASLDITSSAIRELLRKLAHEMRYPGMASAILTEALSRQIAVEIGRHFNAVDVPAAMGGLAPWRLRVIDERLGEVGKAPTVAELAVLCSMSSRHLARSFRASRGFSLGDYILQMRIDRAKRLLAGQESITEIASHLGFSSLAGFSFAFRRGVGVSPRQFRARALRKRR